LQDWRDIFALVGLILNRGTRDRGIDANELQSISGHTGSDCSKLRIDSFTPEVEDKSNVRVASSWTPLSRS
jgi:hypothetical protein